MAKSPSRVRTYRKAFALTERELAELVGMISQRSFSEMETGLKRPGLSVALACALALDVPVPELFPGLETCVEHEMLARARMLHTKLESDARRTLAAEHVAALIRKLTHPHV